jgi:hypothetical protein
MTTALVRPQVTPPRPSEAALALTLTVAAIVATLTTMGRVAVLLCAAMALSCWLWLADRVRAQPRTLSLFVVAIAVLLLHIGEEYATGFQRAFPGLLGYQWSNARFLAYNLTWIAVFAIAAVGLRRGVALATLAVAFCAIGTGVANGVGHLVLALAARGYFPGLLTAPLCFAAGVALLRSIWQPSGATA